MPVTLGANKTISVNSKVIEIGKIDSTAQLESVSQENMSSAPTMTSTAPIPSLQTAGTGIKYLSFTTANTPYNVTFPTSVSCDILIVGGGGGGGGGYFGGGGGVLYMVNKIFQGGITYRVRVGAGTMTRGGDSTITLANGTSVSFDGKTLIGKGGGQAGGGAGGSGGGWNGAAQQGNTFWNGTTYVFGGSAGGNAGGGGAGQAGSSTGGAGGAGRAVNITGSSLVMGAGGAGGGGNSLGGGSGTRNGADNKGGGGAYTSAGLSGQGGSGIVILRFNEYYLGTTIVYNIPVNFRAEWTYNDINANVYYLGNVGIGTATPTNHLHVIGNTQSSTYSGGSKNFKIKHPLKLNKWLYHGCTEGPRFDNIYRGKKIIIDGRAEVDIDKECNTTGGMTPGTFDALNTNHQLYLQNNKTYDVVKGEINGSIINIECENTTDEIEVDWLVMGERHDEHVINTELTDTEGNLICEHEIL